MTFKSLKPLHSFTLAVQSTDTISDIKSQLASQPRAPPADAQRLLLKGKALVDNKLLKEYDVKDGDTINLMVKPGFNWDPTKTSEFPISAPEEAMQPSGSDLGATLAPAHRHTRTPSIVLSPSPSVASLEREATKSRDITLTLDTSVLPTSALASASRPTYQTTLSEPEFWHRLFTFLRGKFANEHDAVIAFEDFLRASGMTANEMAKIRDHMMWVSLG